jgi:putative ABC transport system permease protein
MRADEAFNAMTLTGSRLVRGSIILLAGIILTGTGLFARPGGTAGIIGISSFGAILLFLGVASLSATVARPVTRVLGAPVERIFGTAGHLARENASRQPRRTASTASALMIGIALVSTFAVVGQSFKSTLNDVLHRSVKADYFVKTDSFQGFPAKFAAEVRAVPGIDAVSSFRQGKLQVNGDTKTIGAINPNTWAKLVDLNVQAGSVEALSNGGVLLQVDPAKSLNLRVGSKVAVTWPSGKQESLPVVGIYKDAGVVNTNWLVSIATLEAAGTGEQNDFFVAAKMTAGANSATVRAAIDKVALDFPQVTVQNRAEFQKGQEDQINQVLVIVNALLGLTVLIALLGIANTLALSVFERTRELGLMRAVGMSRRQLKRMVRWESVIVSVFGALLGIAVGVLLGAALANALPESLISTVAIPYGTLVTLVIVAIVSGMLAAAFPARRASKLDILGAIAAS